MKISPTFQPKTGVIATTLLRSDANEPRICFHFKLILFYGPRHGVPDLIDGDTCNAPVGHHFFTFPLFHLSIFPFFPMPSHLGRHFLMLLWARRCSKLFANEPTSCLETYLWHLTAHILAFVSQNILLWHQLDDWLAGLDIKTSFTMETNEKNHKTSRKCVCVCGCWKIWKIEMFY